MAAEEKHCKETVKTVVCIGIIHLSANSKVLLSVGLKYPLVFVCSHCNCIQVKFFIKHSALKVTIK